MISWTQVYDPLGHWWLSTLVAALPIVVLFALLAGFKIKPHWAGLAGVLTAITASIAVFHMPLALASMSFLYGVAFGLLKIAWIVVAAVFLYDISVETGQFEIMKQSVATITPDRRLQVLLVAFSFGAFIEGAAGFGAPVAIAGAFMIGLGFRPFHAAVLNLIANTAPVAFGSIGTPVHTLAAVSGLSESDLSAMIGRILPLTAVVVPFWLVRTMVSWRETLEVWPAILVVGGSFGAVQYFWSNYVDSNLVDIAGGVLSLAAAVLFLRFWQPKRIWRFPEEQIEVALVTTSEAAKQGGERGQSLGIGPKATPDDQKSPISQAPLTNNPYSAAEIAKAWMPFAILSLLVLLWGVPRVKRTLNQYTTPAFKQGGWDVPLLHKAVNRAVPVVPKPTAEPAKYDFNWLTATGSACFLAAMLSGLLLGLRPGTLARIFGRTFYKMRFAMLAISFMLGLGYVTRYSGMDAVLGLAFTRTGWFFPFFGTFLGWLGVALTGSDTSSNALFGSLQRITSQQLKLDPILMCSANSAGGVMGKMVDAQSIVVASAATNQVGNEGEIFKFVFWHSVALASIVGMIVIVYAYVLPHAVPHGLTFIR